MKILVAVDSSDISTRALGFALDLGKKLAKPPAIIVVAVDPPLFPGVERKIGAVAAQRHHAENFERMLKPARKRLARRKGDHETLEIVGEVAESLLSIAKKRKVDQIVMGSHGNGAVKGLLLGSVSSKVIAGSDLPVTIVR